MNSYKSDVLVIGGGISGCFAALKAASHGLEVNIVMKGKDAEESNTFHAQGGIVFKGEEDSSEHTFAGII